MTISAFNVHLEELRTVIEVALVGTLDHAGWPNSLKTSVEYSLMASGCVRFWCCWQMRCVAAGRKTRFRRRVRSK